MTTFKIKDVIGIIITTAGILSGVFIYLENRFDKIQEQQTKANQELQAVIKDYAATLAETTSKVSTLEGKMLALHGISTDASTNQTAESAVIKDPSKDLATGNNTLPPNTIIPQK